MSLEWGNRYRQDVTGGNAAYLDQLTELRRLLYRCRGSHRVNRRAPPRLLRRDPARVPLWAGPVGAPLARWVTSPAGPAVGPMGYQDVTLGRRSKAVTLSIISAFAWIIPLFGFPFCLTALGVALRDRKPGSSRLVPSWVLPLT